jgi:hypothetical protein
MHEFAKKALSQGTIPLVASEDSQICPGRFFALSGTCKMGHLILKIRREASLRAFESIFIFVGEKNLILTADTNISEIYKEHKNDDGLLLVNAQKENAFGF